MPEMTMESIDDIEAYILECYGEGYDPTPEDVAQVYVDHRASVGEYGGDGFHVTRTDALELDYVYAKSKAAHLMGVKDDR